MTLLEILQVTGETMIALLKWGITLSDAHPLLAVSGLLSLAGTGITLVKKLSR